MASGIYEIVNVHNGRRYVGSAMNIDKRWKEHRRGLRNGEHHSRFLQRCWDKYGADSFRFSVLLLCSRDNLLMYEQAAIDALHPEYNAAPRAGSQLGFKMSEESKAKMSASRPKDFSPMTGKTHSAEAKAKISASRKGKGGGPRTPERLAKISAALKGRTVTPEMRARISATLTGHKQSAEQIEKRMQKLRGRKMPEGFSESARQRMLGKKASPETILKMSASKSKLSAEQVIAIRNGIASGTRQRVLAATYCVDQSVISTIKTGAAYNWVI